jgi:hypothetical protein
MSFKDFFNTGRGLNEIPKYIDHDYLPFKPMENRSMQALEAKWTELELKVPSSKIKVLKEVVDDLVWSSGDQHFLKTLRTV